MVTELPELREKEQKLLEGERDRKAEAETERVFERVFDSSMGEIDQTAQQTQAPDDISSSPSPSYFQTVDSQTKEIDHSESHGWKSVCPDGHPLLHVGSSGCDWSIPPSCAFGPKAEKAACLLKTSYDLQHSVGMIDGVVSRANGGNILASSEELTDFVLLLDSNNVKSMSEEKKINFFREHAQWRYEESECSGFENLYECQLGHICISALRGQWQSKVGKAAGPLRFGTYKNLNMSAMYAFDDGKFDMKKVTPDDLIYLIMFKNPFDTRPYRRVHFHILMFVETVVTLSAWRSIRNTVTMKRYGDTFGGHDSMWSKNEQLRLKVHSTVDNSFREAGMTKGPYAWVHPGGLCHGKRWADSDREVE